MPVVVNISSDEEEGFEEDTKITDFDWLKELLFASDGESDDDVVIVGESKPGSKPKSSKTVAVEDDDDCVVLEGDPDKGVTSVDEESTGSDDLLVVGEKGQVACRDYPHARHLCAKYPFSSTPHERHCDQCHCYVCDSLAPCLKWGTGISSSDHCHANDKTELWKLQRKNFKLGLSSPLPASTNYGTAVHVVHPQSTLPQRILLRDSTSLPPNSGQRIQASRSKNQLSRSTNIPVYSTTTNVTISNGADYGRSKELGSTLVRRRIQPIPVPKELLGVRSPAILKERGHRSSLGSHFLRPHMMPKQVGSSRDLTMNNSSRGSSGFKTRVMAAQQRDIDHTASWFSKHRNHNGTIPNNLSSFSHPTPGPARLSCASRPTMTVTAQAYVQPLPQSHDSQGQSWIPGNDAPSSYVACLNNNQHGDKHQLRSQNENANGSMSSQPKPHEESRSETARNFSAVDVSWTENTSQSIEPVIDFSSQQSSGSINQPLNVEESCSQLTGSVEPPTESSGLPNSIADIDSWLFDKDFIPVVTDSVFPSELNIPSPDLDPVDSGMFLSRLW